MVNTLKNAGGAECDGLLASAFGGRVPAAELETWRHLKPHQRERARCRLEAIVGWDGGRGDLAADKAAETAGLSLSRFYRLAARWRERPGLSAIGTFAAPVRRASKFKPEVINALQAHVAEVVSGNADASVAALVDRLVEAAGVCRDDLPGATKLREIVQAEQRRRSETHDAGTAIVFDMVAVSLRRPDGRPHVMFACLDSGTRAILGVAIGDVASSVAGHAAAAADAVAMIDGGSLGLPWGRRLARAELTSGLDVDACRALVRALGEGRSTANIQLSTRPNRFGRYFRALIGPRFGRIAITPTRTVDGDAMSADGADWSEQDALQEIRAAAAEHNASLRRTPADGNDLGDAPPKSLIQTLRAISDVRAGV